jgi:hypothetical protein
MTIKQIDQDQSKKRHFDVYFILRMPDLEGGMLQAGKSDRIENGRK